MERDIIVDGCNLSSELRLLNLNQADVTVSFIELLHSRNTFSDDCCKSFLSLLGGKPVKQRQKNVELILEWINLTPVEKRK